jgi:hypothetical protein
MICGAEACKLGAMIHGVELRVHFLKSFKKGSTCKNLSQKGQKKVKKSGLNGGLKLRAPPWYLFLKAMRLRYEKGGSTIQ